MPYAALDVAFCAISRRCITGEQFKTEQYKTVWQAIHAQFADLGWGRKQRDPRAEVRAIWDSDRAQILLFR